MEPSGEGSHLWLQLEKTGATTDWAAAQLARLAGCHPRDVGFAGMKDRHAVTSQWFSVPLKPTDEESWHGWSIPDARILRAARHGRKLKRGVLRGNRFRLVLRALEGNVDDLEARLVTLQSRGLPNYFGPQRFGHGGANVWRAATWLRDGGRLQRSRRSIYLSAVRSFLFNQVLAERLRRECWDRLLDGDVAMLDGSHSVFPVELPDAALVQRCADLDIHPSGPLPGDAPFEPSGEAAQLESSVLAPYGDLIEGLRKMRVEGARRSLRLVPGELQWQLEDDTLTLEFTLPSGAYATTVIDELVRTRD